MKIIAKNVSGGKLPIRDLGIILDIGEERDLVEDFPDIAKISASVYLNQFVKDAKIVINDGTNDLSPGEGVEHISIETEYSDKTSPSIVGLSSFQCYDDNLPYDLNSSTPIPIKFSTIDLYSEYLSLDSGKIILNVSGFYEIYYHINWLSAFKDKLIKSCIRANGNAFMPKGIAYEYSDSYGTNQAMVTENFSAGDYFEVVCTNLGFKGEVYTLQGESYLMAKYLRGG